MDLNMIYESMQEDLETVEGRIKAVSRVENPNLSQLLDYSLRSDGKKIRPVLTLLSGKFYNYNLDQLVSMAAAVELMHTATLVHDDAIDKSPIRRGRSTVYGERRKRYSSETSCLPRREPLPLLPTICGQ